MISLLEYFQYIEALSSCALSGNKYAEKVLEEHDKAKSMADKMMVIYKYKKDMERIEKEREKD